MPASLCMPGDNRCSVTDRRLTARPVASRQRASEVRGQFARARQAVECGAQPLRIRGVASFEQEAQRASAHARAVPRPAGNRGRRRPRRCARRTPLLARSAATGSRRDTPTRRADTNRAARRRGWSTSSRIGEHLARGHAQQQLRRRPRANRQACTPSAGSKPSTCRNHFPASWISTRCATGPIVASRREGGRRPRRRGRSSSTNRRRSAEACSRACRRSRRGAPCRRAGGREGRAGPSGDPSSVRCRSRGLRSPGR